MKKAFVLLLAIPLFAFGGCDKKDDSKKGVLDTAEDLSDFAEATKDLAEIGNINSDDPEEVAKAWEKIAQVGADFEAREFDDLDSLDAPDGFDKAFIMDDAKVTSTSDTSSDGYVNIQIDLKTKQEFAKVKDFYKSALASNGWKITSQSNATGSMSYSADKGDLSVTVTVGNSSPSVITTISISLYGSTSEGE